MSMPAPRQTRNRSPAAGRESAPGTAEVESSDWLRRLRATGPERERALSELHELLLGAARFALSRRAWELGREGFEDLAVQAADDALMAVLARLDDYRGESRFTTWVWKFAFYEACVAVRKRSWLGREVPAEDSGWDELSREVSPDERLEQAELLGALRRAVTESLTPHQQRVFAALALNQVPVDVLAERLGTSRGALYKTLHEARARLRADLAASGLGPDSWQQPAAEWWRPALQRTRAAAARRAG